MANKSLKSMCNILAIVLTLFALVVAGIHLLSLMTQLSYLQNKLEILPQKVGEGRTLHYSQYNEYWVVNNFIVPGSYNVENRIEVSMSGKPEDLYILNIWAQEMDLLPFTNFAVLLSEPEDLNRTINAMHYLHKCVYIKPFENNKKIFFIIREVVSIQLYFRPTLMHQITMLKDFEVQIELMKPLNCGKIPQRFPQSKPLSIEAYKLENQNRIAGRNVAHLTVSTLFTLHVDINSYPMPNVNAYMGVELNEIAQVYVKRNWRKVLYRVPSIVLLNMAMQDCRHIKTAHLWVTYMESSAFTSTVIKNHKKYDTTSWLRQRVSQYNKAAVNPEMMRYLSHYILYADAPLYDDRDGLNLLSSENLFLYRLSLDGYKVIHMHRNVVVHNATEAELAEDRKSLKSRDLFASIAPSVQKEYEILFASDV